MRNQGFVREKTIVILFAVGGAVRVDFGCGGVLTCEEMEEKVEGGGADKGVEVDLGGSFSEQVLEVSEV